MQRKTIEEIIREFSEKLPKFTDGRINYSTSTTAPVLIIFVIVGEELLLLKRSEEVANYKGRWSGSAGYLDDPQKSVREQVMDELIDELGIDEEPLNKLIVEIKIRKYYKYKDEESGKTWIRTPVLVELKEKPIIKLNWEHTEYRWVEIKDVCNFDTPPGFKDNLRRAL